MAAVSDRTNTHTHSLLHTHTLPPHTQCESNTITATERHLSPFIDSMIGFVWTFLKYKNLQSKCLKFLQLFPTPPHCHDEAPMASTTPTPCPLLVCWPLACVFFFYFFFGELPFLHCLFFVCLLFVRAFDCLLCVALTLFLLCFVSVLFFFLFFDLPRTFGFSFSLTPFWGAVIVGLQFVWPDSPTSQDSAPAFCYCFVAVDLALCFASFFFFFLGRKFMLTVLHWKCINLCVYTMCRHSLSRPEGRGWVWYGRKEELHMCLLSTFYGLCPCLCPCPCALWPDTPYSSIVERSWYVLFTYYDSLSVFI